MSSDLRKPVVELLERSSPSASLRWPDDIAPSGRPFRGTDAGTVQCQRLRSAPANGNDARLRSAGDRDARKARAAVSTAAVSVGAARAGGTPSASPAAPAPANRRTAVRVSRGSRWSSFTSEPPFGA